MRSSQEKSFEEMGTEHDRELDRAASEAADAPVSISVSPSLSAPEGTDPFAFRYDSSPLPGAMAVREAAVFPLGVSASDGYAALVERMISRVWHTLYTLSEQRDEIVRLRDSTRQVLARLSAA